MVIPKELLAFHGVDMFGQCPSVDMRDFVSCFENLPLKNCMQLVGGSVDVHLYACGVFYVLCNLMPVSKELCASVQLHCDDVADDDLSDPDSTDDS